MIELACKEAVFHFNKHHLVDPTIPMWVIKTKGQTYMINHVDCQIPWSTKETPSNESTKGSIKFKNALLTIDDSNNATISSLKLTDIARLKAKSFTRILFNSRDKEIKEFISEQNIHHTEFKNVKGSCGKTLVICDIKKSNDMTLLKLSIPNLFRILQENEEYYKMYDNDNLRKSWDPDNEDFYFDDSDDGEDNEYLT